MFLQEIKPKLVIPHVIIYIQSKYRVRDQISSNFSLRGFWPIACLQVGPWIWGRFQMHKLISSCFLIDVLSVRDVIHTAHQTDNYHP